MNIGDRSRSSLILGIGGFAIAVLFFPFASWGAVSKYEFNLGLNSGYESNIYHSFADSLVTSAFVNTFSGQAIWKKKFARRFSSRALGYFDLDYYPKYSQRKRSSFGLRLEPTLRYNKKGRFEIGLDISRRNKDLIDDSGQSLARSLKRWNFDFDFFHRYDFSRFKLEQGIQYSKLNYDEVIGLISYDYYSWTPVFNLRAEISPIWIAKVSYSGEKRNYLARRTYTIQYGAFVGRPFEIRNFWQHSVEVSLSYEFISNNKFEVGMEYSKRSENFENFYGFTHRQYRAKLDLKLEERNRTEIIFRFKDKSYPNYWTSAIGRLNRVWVDYADFQFENTFQITANVSLLLFAQNYNKISNDPSFDYSNFTAGTGVNFSY